MALDHIPTTTGVYIFNNEIDELLQRIVQEPSSDGLYCCLHGLWTHGSNPVVYLIVSNQEERDKALEHQLNCVGYAAKKYTPNLHVIVSDRSKISPVRQHIVVDVNKTKRDGSLHAFVSHPSMKGDPIHERREPLKVITLDIDDSPFRKELREMDGKTQGERGQTMVDQNESGQRKVDQNESETGQLYENQENSLADVTSVPKWSIVDRIMHKIKHEFDPGEIRKTSQIVFTHNGGKWKIELETKQGRDDTSATIHCPEHEEAPSILAVHESRLVVEKIKQLCQCTMCKKLKF